MATFYFSTNLGGNRTLCLAPLSERNLVSSGQHIDDASGYFLYEKRGSGDGAEIEVIAQAMSDHAALKLRELLDMA